MPVDTKEIIIQSFRELLEKKDGRVTIMEIVKHCNLNRKTFYYHFSDITDLVDVMVGRDMDALFHECMQAEDLREVLSLFFSFLLKYRPQIKKAIAAGYYPSTIGALGQTLQGFFMGLVEKKGWLYDPQKTDFDITLHCYTYAILGELIKADKESEVNIEKAVDESYRFLTGQLDFLPKC